jgi:hypothetical protein
MQAVIFEAHELQEALEELAYEMKLLQIEYFKQNVRTVFDSASMLAVFRLQTIQSVYACLLVFAAG